MKKIIFIMVISVLTWGAQCRAEGLQALIEVGRSMKDVKQASDEETKNFGRAKSAVEGERIKKGQTKQEVMRSCGEPVIMVQEHGREKWVYKPAEATFFKGTKIYLFFGPDETLDEIKVMEQ
ncbi:MAG: hypothetical protein PHP46_05385 [Candidatus Omnitrophica bacterium]|nr:hypothetical protein [Candidatus Omnitrophota bacterium]